MNEKKANCCEEMLAFFEGILSNSLNNVKEFLDYWNMIKDSREHKPYIDDLHKFLRDQGQIPTVVSMHHDNELNQGLISDLTIFFDSLVIQYEDYLLKRDFTIM